MREYDVSLVIPVFNEEENLPVLLEEIGAAMGPYDGRYEILFVDDASVDGGPGILDQAGRRHEHIRCLTFAENRGQSAAFSAGFEHAAGRIIVTMDSDLQNDPADIPRMLQEYEKGADMVIGWRRKRQDSTAKRLASKFANWVRNKVSHETVKDTGCSLKVMRASMARKIPMFVGMHRFLPTLMKLQGARVVEIPVNHRPRRHGKSKYGVLDRALTTWYDLLAVRWMQKRYISYTIKEK